jgi:acetyl-CoA carboxylase carboxyltransferase component
MNWKPELDDLARREAFAREMGGVDKVKRQHDQGRLTVRERIDRLIDKNSFHEIGTISGIAEYDENSELKHLTPANCVFGRANVNGRTVVVVGDDFTVRGGSADASISAKPLMAEEMAHDFRLPIVRVIEGSGGGGSVKTIETTGRANLPGGLSETTSFDLVANNMQPDLEIPLLRTIFYLLNWVEAGLKTPSSGIKRKRRPRSVRRCVQ